MLVKRGLLEPKNRKERVMAVIILFSYPYKNSPKMGCFYYVKRL